MSVAVAAPPSPYKGLAPFEDSDLDALLFFGREREREIIAANLIAARVTVLYGPSGVGKSSVLRAGVAHRLRQEHDLEVVVFSTWTGDPVAALIEAVGGNGDSIVDALADTADRAGGDVYLILDQFEELFLYHRRGGRFAQQLAEVVRRPGLRVHILIGIREDALARLDVLKASIPNLLANRLRLERLDRAAGLAAIVGPVGRYNELVAPEERVKIEPELKDAILDEVTAGRVDLSVVGRGVAIGSADENRIEAPYLQLVLARLWEVEAERGSKMLMLATLRELGGAERIVEEHLERAMAALSPREKGAAAAMYNFLVTPSGTKIAHGISDLAGYASVDEGEAAGVLDRLTAERIVRASSTNGPSTTRYEIFHDVLADAVLAWRTRFEAERQIAEERARHLRRQRRLVAIGAGALLAVAVLTAVAVYALAQRSEARHQAEVAKQAQVKAEQSAATANEALENEASANEKAQVNEQKAEANEKKARQSEQNYKHAAAHAQDEEQRANDAAAAERHTRVRAQAAEGVAKVEARRAKQQTAFARRETHKKARAQALAVRQTKTVRAQKLEAEARELLSGDEEQSVRRSLAAISAFRAARIPPGVGVQDTLRAGLTKLRLKAVLPGGSPSPTFLTLRTRPVNVVRFSPDGSLLFVGGAGGARIYDLRPRHHFAVRRLLPRLNVKDAAFSPDGSTIVAAGGGTEDRAAQVWDVRSGTPLLTLKHDGPVLTAAYSPNGRWIATGSEDKTARLWDAATGAQLGAPFVHDPGATTPAYVSHVSFSPDSKRILTVGGNKFARVFDVARHEEVFPGGLNHLALVKSARFSHDGKLIATAGSSHFVRVWDAATGRELYKLEGTGQVNELAFSPDDTLLGTAGSDDTLGRVWDLATRSSVAIITAHRGGVESIDFTPDGQSVVTAGDKRALIVQTIGGIPQAVLAGHNASVSEARVSPDGTLIATASADGTARLWDATVGPVGTGGLPPAEGHLVGRHDLPTGARGPVVAFSPDGLRILSAGADGFARLWGPRGRVEVLKHDRAVSSASFSKDGKTVITGSDDGTARVWRVRDGRSLASLPHGAPVTVARLTADGRLAVTAGSDGRVVVWSVASASPVRIYSEPSATNDAQLSRDGRFVVIGSADGTAAVLGVTARSARILRGHTGPVVAVAFSPDGRHVATASSADDAARLWDIRTGASRKLLPGHKGGLITLAFNGDGSLLATAGRDAEVGIYNRKQSWSNVGPLRLHSGTVNDLTFSADGRWLATAGPLAAGIWETRRKGAWLDEPLYLVHAASPPSLRLDHVAFSPRGWRLLMGYRSGGVFLYNCKLCGGIKELTAIAHSQLGAIARPKG
jgi:WD40 repeat protein